MKNRLFEKLLDICIVIGAIASLVMISGVLEGSVQPSKFASLFSVTTIIAILYYVLECMYIWNRKKGIFFSLGKYIVFTSMTFCAVFAWLFMQPFYRLESNMVQQGYVIGHVVVPFCIFLEYMVSDKGHFNKKFWITYMLLILLYGTSILSAGYFSKMYPYAFLNPEQLSYDIIWKECVLLVLVIGIYARIVLAIDQRYKRKRK